MSDPVEALLDLVIEYKNERHPKHVETLWDAIKVTITEVQSAAAIRFESAGTLDVERLANIIREVDGDHDLGAAALAGAILARLSSSDTGWPRHVEGCPANGGSFLVCTCNLSSSDTER